MKYRERPELSQSYLKLLLHDPTSFFEEKENSSRIKSHFQVGKSVDFSLAHGLQELTSKIAIIEERPDGMLTRVAEYLIDNDLPATEENILFAREEVNYDRRLKDVTVIARFDDTMRWYYDILSEIKPDEILLTREDYETVCAIYMSLTTHKYTKHFFEPREDIIRLNHVEVYYNYLGVACKAEIDQLDVNLRNNTVKPIDYKTLGFPTRFFPRQCRERRYDIQGASYTYGLSQAVKGVAETNLTLDLEGFTVLPFEFIVETTVKKKIGKSPLVYRMSPNMFRSGMFGTYVDKKYTPSIYSADIMDGLPQAIAYTTPLIPGFDALIREYKYQISLPVEDRGYTRYEDLELSETGAISLDAW